MSIFSIYRGICLDCSEASDIGGSFAKRLLKHMTIDQNKEVVLWGCPYCQGKHYFLMPRPRYTYAVDYLDELAESLMTWPDEKFYAAKKKVEQNLEDW